MKKLYYFSKTNQSLKQFRYLSINSVLIYIGFAIFLGIFTWLIGYTIDFFTNSSKSFSALENENKVLKAKVTELAKRYETLNESFSEILKQSNYLRLAANLSPLTSDELAMGIGGSEFETIPKLNNLNEITKFVEKLSLKIKFEKNEYELITQKLKENKKLFSSLPAIKPCSGEVGVNGFGMREHPILGINRMHEGIDIITDIGTKVHAAGNGVVSFVGYRGGYGLSVEIEHEFGYKTVYAHLFRSLVKEGKKVLRGESIALTGNSGLSTGPHLHYEVHHDGIKLDPSHFFYDDLAFFEQPNKK